MTNVEDNSISHSRYPYYCTTREEAERCADIIANEHRCFFVEEQNGIRTYRNDDLRIDIQIFRDNWKGDQWCFSFSGEVTRVTSSGSSLQQGLPYLRVKRGEWSRQMWRKIPDYFANDISLAIRNLYEMDDVGKIVGEIYEWRENGYGFARAIGLPKIFIHIRDIPKVWKERPLIGKKIRMRVDDEGRGPRAKAIEILP